MMPDDALQASPRDFEADETTEIVEDDHHAGGSCDKDSNVQSSREARTRKQMRYIRRLQQAMDEGARTAVLRTALAQAREAGCQDAPSQAPIVVQFLERGAAMLPHVETLEKAVETGCVETIQRHIPEAEAVGAMAHVKIARDQIHTIEIRAAEQELAAASALFSLDGLATSIARLKITIGKARQIGVSDDILELYNGKLRSYQRAQDVAQNEVRAVQSGALGKTNAAARRVRSAPVTDSRAGDALNSLAVTAKDVDVALTTRCVPLGIRFQSERRARSCPSLATGAAAEETDTGAIKRRALMALLRALADRTPCADRCRQLRAAIDVAKADNVDLSFIQRAEVGLAHLERRARLRKELQEATQHVLVVANSPSAGAELDEALARLDVVLCQATSADLPVEDIHAGREAVAQAEQKRACREALSAAIEETMRLNIGDSSTEQLLETK